jgi:hypothetical protein
VTGSVKLFERNVFDAFDFFVIDGRDSCHDRTLLLS